MQDGARVIGRLGRNRPLVIATLAGLGVTLVVVGVPFARFAYDNPALHLALETAEGLIAGLLAYLAFKRYVATGRLQDVVLAWAFSLFAFVNLVLSAGPLITERERYGGWLTWATVGFRLIGSAALCAGAYVGRDAAPRRGRVRAAVAVATAATIGVVSAASLFAATSLAEPVVPIAAFGDFTRPRLVAHPVVMGAQLLALAFWAGGAVYFTRQAVEHGDELLRWLGAGAVLGSFARLNYFLFPSLYSNLVYSGDLLRLGAYLFFLIGAVREIDAYWRDQTRFAATEERRRMARELHDGLAQELAFIRSQTASMAAGLEVPGMVQHLSAAAERALAESRRAVQALSDGVDGGDGVEPLVDALTRAAEEVVARAGATVEVEAEASPSHSGASVHAHLVRVAREAATNAVRHGGATKVSLRLSVHGDRLCLVVADDGRGFDPEKARGGYGLRGMRERVEGLGGEFTLRSSPGEGTVIEVEVPGIASG